MNKKQEFIEFIEDLIKDKEMPEGARIFWEIFKTQKKEITLTDNGKIILTFLKDNLDTSLWKSKNIAEKIGLSSRTVSGAMRKLVSDGFVEKVSVEPVVYAITEKGKNYNI